MKKLMLIGCVALISLSLQAQESKPDPSDLTQVNSFAFATADSNGDIKGMLGLAGAYSEGNNFLGLVEHGSATKKGFNDRKAQNTRLRYFQVLDTGGELLPQAGFSVDYIRGWKYYNGVDTNLVALGAIAKLKTPWEAFTLFPNLAYVSGDAKADGLAKVNIKGYQANLFGSLAIGDWGQYLALQPQWMDTDAGSKFEMKTAYGQPLSTDGKWWLEIAHEYIDTTPKGQFMPLGTDRDNKFTIGVSYYF